MNEKRVACIFFIFIFIFIFIEIINLSLSAFEFKNKNNHNINFISQTKTIEPILINQNYLLPLEKILSPTKKNGVENIKLTAKSVLVIDNNSGKIIYEKNAHKKLSVASLTKLATVYTILQQVDKNIYFLDKNVLITSQAVDQEGDRADIKEGEIFKARDLLAAMLISSSNDAAWALAEDAGRSANKEGGVKDFIELMNIMVKNEKLYNTHFSNPTGIDQKENFSSASDILYIAQKLFRYYPEIFSFSKIKKMDIKSQNNDLIHKLKNTNKLLSSMPEIVGGKTGFTDEAGESLVLIVKNNKNGIIISAVIIGSDNRFLEMKKLIDWIWNAYEWK